MVLRVKENSFLASGHENRIFPNQETRFGVSILRVCWSGIVDSGRIHIPYYGKYITYCPHPFQAIYQFSVHLVRKSVIKSPFSSKQIYVIVETDLFCSILFLQEELP